MEEHISDAKEELKRADHLLYVSLKYSRTVDVIKNLVDRLINAIGFSIDTVLVNAKKRKLIQEVPTNPAMKCNLIKKEFDDATLHEMADLYLHLRKISRAEYSRSREFRRHVTMTAVIDGGALDVNIDLMKEYYEKTVSYVNYCHDLIEGSKE